MLLGAPSPRPPGPQEPAPRWHKEANGAGPGSSTLWWAQRSSLGPARLPRTLPLASGWRSRPSSSEKRQDRKGPAHQQEKALLWAGPEFRDLACPAAGAGRWRGRSRCRAQVGLKGVQGWTCQSGGDRWPAHPKFPARATSADPGMARVLKLCPTPSPDLRGGRRLRSPPRPQQGLSPIKGGAGVPHA